MSDKEIKDRILTLVKAEDETIKGNAPTPTVDYTFLQECFRANELGDGTYFAHLHRGKFLYVKKLETWLAWAGQHWQVDHMERVYHGVEDVALAYLDYAYQLGEMITEEKKKEDTDTGKVSRLSKEKEAYLKRAWLLRATNRPEACIRYAHRLKNRPIAITGDDLDADPWLLACKNGIIDLKTGELRQGKPEDYISKAIAHDYEGFDAPAPEWDAALRSIFEAPDDLKDQCKEYPALEAYLDNRGQYTEDLVSAFRRAFGYAITGLSKEHFFLVLTGEGRNGKTLLTEAIKNCLKPLAGVIPSEMLLDQGRAKGSGGPSPELMLLKGLRLAFASETDENRRFSPGQIKWMTGGDSIIARDLHSGYIEFLPTHSLVLLTNHLPQAPAEDFAFWERLKLFPFNWTYRKQPQKGKNQKLMDPTLPAKLEKETAGILAWLVRGCLEYQMQGLNWPLVVQVATEKYRTEGDMVGQFIEEWCEKTENPDARRPFKDVYAAYKKWYTEYKGTEKNIIQQKEFGELFGKRFRKIKSGGNVYFLGVEVNEPV